MYPSSAKTPLDRQQLHAARAIRFLDREETRYPLLMRLSMDFGFRVLQLHPRVYSHISRQWVPVQCEFILASQNPDSRLWYQWTPGFSSLELLHDYAARHEIDLLHAQLFGDEDGDLAQGY